MSYKNHKDQKLISEAYEQIQEAAPVGLGSRFGNWAAQKALKYVPLTGGVKAKIQGKQEYANEANELKKGLNLFLGKYNLKNASKVALGRYLSGAGYNGKTVKSLLQTTNTEFAVPLTDKQINEYIKSAVTQKGYPEGGMQFQQQPLQDTQQKNDQLPDRPLDQMNPQMKAAWIQFFNTNPKAYSEYTKKFGKRSPTVLKRKFTQPPTKQSAPVASTTPAPAKKAAYAEYDYDA